MSDGRRDAAPSQAPVWNVGISRAVLAMALAVLGAFSLAPLSAANAAERVMLGSFATESGVTGGKVALPSGIAINRTGAGGAEAGSVYVANSGSFFGAAPAPTARIEQFSSEGTFIRAFGLDVVASGEHNTPDGGPEICEADSDPVDICKGGVVSAAAASVSGPEAIAVSQLTGHVFVASAENNRIDVFSATGRFEGAFGFNVDPAGGSGLEICTLATACQAGAVSGKGGGFAGLTKAGLAIDPATGNLYIGERGNLRIAEFSFSFNGANEMTGVSFVRAIGFNVAAPWANEAQAVLRGVTGNAATGGTYRLCKDVALTQCTGNLAFNLAPTGATSVQGALEGLLGAGTVTVTGTGANARSISFGGSLGATNVDELVCDGANLTYAGAAPSPRCTVTTTVNGSGSGPSFEICTDAEQCQVGLAGGGNGQFSVGTPTSLAVDSAGFIYAVTGEGTCNASTTLCRVQKFNPNGTFKELFGPASGGAAACQLTWTAGAANAQTAGGITVDPSTQNVIVTRRTAAGSFELCEFNSAGTSLVERFPTTPLATLSAGAGSGYLKPEVGLGGAVYVNTPIVAPASGGAGAVHVLGIPPAPPMATILPVADLTASSATLKGQVTVPAPGGFGYRTGYRFELSDDFGQTWLAVPEADLDAGSVAGVVLASRAFDELRPNSKYRVRLVATNVGGSDTSSEFFFETPKAPPTLANLRALPVTGTTTKLRASINPNNLPTTYRFEWGTSTTYGSQSPDFEPLAGEGSSPVPIVVSLGGLAPGVTYHYRLVATNSAGATAGPDKTFTTDPCPARNEAGLPSCRRFELVSPADQGPVGQPGRGAELRQSLQRQASPDGNHLAYVIGFGLPDSTSGSEVIYRSDRDDAGWAPTQLAPPLTVPTWRPSGGNAGQNLYLSEDLGCGFLASYSPLTEDSPDSIVEAGGAFLYRHDADGELTLVPEAQPSNPGETGTQLNNFSVIGASDDCDRVVFATKLQYPGVPYSGSGNVPGLYEWSDADGLKSAVDVPGPSGSVVAVGALPGGRSADGANPYGGAVSEQGDNFVFTANRQLANGPGGSGELGKRAVFVRVNGGVAIDVSRSETAVASQNSFYQAASVDGSRIFFLGNYGLAEENSSNGATNADCSANGAQRCDLYEYDLSKPLGDRLTSLSATKAPANPNGAMVEGVLDSSPDGRYVYFAAKGQLVPAKGNTYAQNTAGAGAYNIYLAHNDSGSGRSLHYVATVSAGDFAFPPGPVVGLLAAPKAITYEPEWSSRVAADSGSLLFQSRSNVTGYESGGAVEAYLFDPDSDTIVCVSCRTDGQPAIVDPFSLPVPGRGPGSANYQFRPAAISANGKRVFFRVKDALASGAVSGSDNLYQWDQGVVSLIATFPNVDNLGSVTFLGASEDGASVFFQTFATLVPEDVDGGRSSVYVARVNGGFAPPPTPAAPCDPLLEGACQGTPSQPLGTTPPATSSQVGSGNVPSEPNSVKPKKKGKKKNPSKGKKNKSGKGKSKSGKQKKRAKAKGPGGPKQQGSDPGVAPTDVILMLVNLLVVALMVAKGRARLLRRLRPGGFREAGVTGFESFECVYSPDGAVLVRTWRVRRSMRRRYAHFGVALALLIPAGAMLGAATASAAAPAWRATAVTGPTHLAPGSSGEIAISVTNVGAAASDGTPITAEFTLPPGIVPSSRELCTATLQAVLCSKSVVVPARHTLQSFSLPVAVGAIPEQSFSVDVAIKGGGGAEYTRPLTIEVSSTPAGPGIDDLWAGAFDADGVPDDHAGAHPRSAGLSFRVNTIKSPLGQVIPAGTIRDLHVGLPPGFGGNPTATKRCPTNNPGECGESGAVVGVSRPQIESFPGGTAEADFHPEVFNFDPPPGYAAGFTFRILEAKAEVFGTVRSDQDYGIELFAPNIQTTYQVFGVVTMLDGLPPGGEGKPFLTNPTDCGYLEPVTSLIGNTWQSSPLFNEATTPVPAMTECDQLEFAAYDEETDTGQVAFGFQPSLSSAATPVGATAHLHVDQENLLDPNALATPHLRESKVVLPVGMNLNPAAADGLQACTTEQIGFIGNGFPLPNPTRFDEESPACPDGSKIGTAQIETPLLDDPLNGTVYLAAQGDNPFNSLLAMYVVIDDARTGIVAKLPGKVVPDPQTGQLTATFENNPQVPFEDLVLNFRGGGPRSTLATPDVCGNYTTAGSWTPWSAPDSGPAAETTDDFAITSGVGGSASCPKTKAERPFGLGFEAGSTSPIAGAHSPFRLRITRPDGAQEIDKVSIATPPGFAATLAGVPVCSDAQVAQALSRSNPGDGQTELDSPSCPASSQVGTTTIGAGVGSQPYYVKTGKIYRTGAYKGAKQSLTFIVPIVAGPFDLGVQVVRTALNVNPVTAQITAESDPIPQILQGIPVQIRDIRVDLDRPNFTINPTNCSEMAVSGQITGGSGAVANVSNRFQVDNCAALGFKPSLKLTYKGQTKRSGNPALRAVLTQPPGQANISGTQVLLPLGSIIDNEHVNNPCTRAQYAANACPSASILGTAMAWSPLLDQPLSGNVYFRSNGGERELPDLVAALKGEVDVELVGFVDAVENKKKGTSRVRNTFAVVPDAPVSRFELKMKGGKFGLIENSKNLCKGKNKATVRMWAHNGRTLKFDPKVATDCRKKGKGKKGGGKGR